MTVMDKKQISERPCDYQHYKGISTGEHSEAVCDLNGGKEKEDAFNCVF